MTTVRLEEALENLGPGESLECGGCHWMFSPDSLLVLDATALARNECPACGENAFVPHKLGRPVEQRWPGCGPWTPLPNAFLRAGHGRLLGLAPIDVLLVTTLETYRVDPDEPVWPSLLRVAKDVGTSHSTVKRHVSMMLRAGLYEGERRKRDGGTFGTYALTNGGLRRALALIVRNVDEGHPPERGLDVLLAELRATQVHGEPASQVHGEPWTEVRGEPAEVEAVDLEVEVGPEVDPLAVANGSNAPRSDALEDSSSSSGPGLEPRTPLVRENTLTTSEEAS